jgi:EmrB/QacA subfamily drug resistance transporter
MSSAAAARAGHLVAAQPVAEDSARPRHALLLSVCCLAQFMVILDVAIVNVALPSIRASLGFSATDLQWIVNAYTITFAGFLMLSGRATDLFGQRKTFVAGLLVFALASLAGGTADSRAMLVGARALQGLGGAIMAAASLAIITSSFAAGPERHRAIGLWGAMNGAGGAAGTLLGGIITQELSWRWILLINLPIGIAAAVAARLIVAERRGKIDWSGFDVGGALAVTGGMLALVYGIVAAGTDGWGAFEAIGPIALGVALLVVFAAIEGRLAPKPLVPLRVFKVSQMRTANSVVLLFSAALFPMWYFTSLYLQEVLHMPPLGAGLAFLPMALTIMACATRAGSLVARVGVRSVLCTGLTLMAAGMALFSALISVNGSYGADVLLPGLLVSIGIGFAVVPSTIAATAGAAPSEAGLASGLVNTSRQMGGALGLAILASLGAQYTSHLLNADYQAPLIALTNGFRLAYLLGAVFAAAAAVLTFRYIPKLPARATAGPSGGGPVPAPAPSAPHAAEDPSGKAPARSPVPSAPVGEESPRPLLAEESPPAPAPVSDNGSAAPVSAPLGARPAETVKPAPRLPARPVATVVFSLSGGGHWPLTSGSMTIPVAGDERARRA